MVTISFPGLGIDNFTVNPVAFTIPIFGGLEVRWYGLIITLGIILAFTYCANRAKHEGILFDQVLDIAIFTIIFSVLGARIYYVVTSLDQYDSFYDMIAIWNGGLAIYGGIIAGAITIAVTCHFKKIKPLKMLDATAPAVMIGQILGRWGNFFNGEAYGSEVMEGNPLYFIRMGLIPNIESVSKMHYFHPTFLYESLWNLIGFILIHCLYKKKKFDGQIILMYITWYGFGRMFIEGLRTDSLYVGVFRISQVIGFLCFVVGSVLLIINLTKARRAALTAQAYNPTYAKVSGMQPSASSAQDQGEVPTQKEHTEEPKKSEESEKPATASSPTDFWEETSEQALEEKERVQKQLSDLSANQENNKQQ